MAAITPTVSKHSSGDQLKIVAKFTSIGDADTWVSGLGARVEDFTCQLTADPTTNTSAGVNVTESAGTFTFYPGIAALAGTLTVYCTGA